MNIQKELISHYMNKSKHSNYQILPKSLESILPPSGVITNTRYELERLKYVFDNVNIKGKSVLDIGGNTGYFSFEALDAGASDVTYVEGNPDHAEFVKLGSKYLGCQEKLRVKNEYFDFSGNYTKRHEIVLLFNVLHHIGDDYGDKSQGLEDAKNHIKKQINSLTKNTNILVLQLGYNWQGDTKKPLFKNGTKQEQIDFVTEAIKGAWNITHVGIAEKVNRKVVYSSPTAENLKRDNKLGEFLNRPIFILETAK